ncbi:MAG: rhodanese-like domain-containing protein [Chloroflexi bacterium]|jgi:rhodanese-related sulfurtransferase|nr:rhodanese-like domain-containing protein [Chloroflexota bacterium]
MRPNRKSGSSGRPQAAAARPPVWVWLAAAAVILLAGLAIFLRPGTRPEANLPADLPAELSVDETLERREAGALILDVREPQEWEQVHIPGAVLIPLNQLQERIDELPRDQEIIVVCRSGNRSAQGRDLLRQAGFTRVSSMAGGMNRWSAAGYPTESGP